MPKCKSCGKRVGWFQVVKNLLLLKIWKVLNSHLFETLCLECIASWNTYFEGFEKCQASGKKLSGVAE
jgi:hypothetical protein